MGAAPITAPPQQQPPQGDGKRLRADRASFRLLVLAFVRDYLAANGGSPSYGEIAAHFDCSRERVRKTVKKLVAKGELLQGTGPRTLSLPSLRNEALRLLEEQGWQIDPAARTVRAPGSPLTDRPLLPPPALDYPGRRNRENRADGDSRTADSRTANSGSASGDRTAAAPRGRQRKIRRQAS